MKNQIANNFSRYSRYSKWFSVLLIATCFAVVVASSSLCVAADVSIVADTKQNDQAATAGELAEYLGRIYPSSSFKVVANGASVAPPKVIDIDIKPSLPAGTFNVQGTNKNELRIEAADIQGLRSGIYALLEKLGCGFYLSYETVPKSPDATLDFSKWSVKNNAKVPARIVFNWHNFLSGCSTWELEDWNRWTDNSQKMGYNSIMVHAYGNNPMAGFMFKGVDKPVGFLSSTRVGRDWATQHVNDIRLLYGGDVFQEPVFGCEASINGTDAERTAAARKLMAPVFQHAQQRGVDVYFAVDVDTTMANPPEQVELLPEHARFSVDLSPPRLGKKDQKIYLPNPDTPEGYDYYKAEVAELLKVYPEIDCLVVWHRTDYTPWMTFKVEEMPKPWQDEFQAAIAKAPAELQKDKHLHHHFAMSKIVKAFVRAARELGRDDVKIAYGSWRFNFLPPANLFMPKDVAFMPLDYEVLHDKSQFDTVEQRAEVAQTAANRDIIPITWAHHDDGNYVGRSYQPYDHFYDKLHEMNCTKSGYGIIHWTTKPLDLYFKSLARQVQENTLNQPLEATCRRMAIDMVGPKQVEPMTAYLTDWITTMPKIARETRPNFIRRILPDYEKAMEGYSRRTALLDKVDTSVLTPQQTQWVDYFRGLEQYIRDAYKNEALRRKTWPVYRKKDFEAARGLIQQCNPEEVVENYARFSQNGTLSRGEKGLIVSMNTRWLPFYVQIRQALALEPIRINFGPTSHDPLAQSCGVSTFLFDGKKQVWETFGLKEVGNQAFAVGDGSSASVLDSGIVVPSILKLSLSPMLDSKLQKWPLVPGKYKLVIDSDGHPYSVDLTWSYGKSKGNALASNLLETKRLSQSHSKSVRELNLEKQGTIEITICPKAGPVKIYAITLTPSK